MPPEKTNIFLSIRSRLGQIDSFPRKNTKANQTRAVNQRALLLTEAADSRTPMLDRDPHKAVAQRPAARSKRRLRQEAGMRVAKSQLLAHWPLSFGDMQG